MHALAVPWPRRKSRTCPRTPSNTPTPDGRYMPLHYRALRKRTRPTLGNEMMHGSRFASRPAPHDHDRALTVVCTKLATAPTSPAPSTRTLPQAARLQIARNTRTCQRAARTTRIHCTCDTTDDYHGTTAAALRDAAYHPTHSARSQAHHRARRQLIRLPVAEARGVIPPLTSRTQSLCLSRSPMRCCRVGHDTLSKRSHIVARLIMTPRET